MLDFERVDCDRNERKAIIINVQKRIICLYLSDLVKNFDLDKMMKKPTIDGKTFRVDIIDCIT